MLAGVPASTARAEDAMRRVAGIAARPMRVSVLLTGRMVGIVEKPRRAGADMRSGDAATRATPKVDIRTAPSMVKELGVDKHRGQGITRPTGSRQGLNVRKRLT